MRQPNAVLACVKKRQAGVVPFSMAFRVWLGVFPAIQAWDMSWYDSIGIRYILFIPICSIYTASNWSIGVSASKPQLI